MNGSLKKGVPDNFIELVEAAGTLINGSDGRVYIVPKDGDPPMRVRSRGGQALILRALGIGRSTPKLRALWLDIEDHAKQADSYARVETTAAFDRKKRDLRVNLGHGSVFFINASELRIEGPDTDGLLFVDEPRFRPVDPDAIKAAWPDVDLVNLPCFTRALLGDLPPSRDALLDPWEQQAVVLAWWLGAFIHDLAIARPILALLGPPACGKTVTGRLLGTAFYGPSYDVSGVAAGSRAEKDVAASLVERTLVVRDDINSAPRGIMDLLCSAATGQRFDLSAFHETLALVSYRPRAVLALTAHTPTWALRDDVLSRLLVLRLAHPLASTRTELDRKRAVLDNRAGLWAETLRLLFHGVVEGRDRFPTVSRFPDWEMVVRRALRAAAREHALVSALHKMKQARVRVAADAEPLLDALVSFAAAERGPGAQPNRELWWTATELHRALALHMGFSSYDDDGHPRAMLRSPASLGRFLSKLAGVAKAVVKVERKRSNRNAWLYRISPKGIE